MSRILSPRKRDTEEAYSYGRAEEALIYRGGLGGKEGGICSRLTGMEKLLVLSSKKKKRCGPGPQQDTLFKLGHNRGKKTSRQWRRKEGKRYGLKKTQLQQKGVFWKKKRVLALIPGVALERETGTVTRSAGQVAFSSERAEGAKEEKKGTVISDDG